MNAAIQERLDRLYRDVYTVCGSLAATAFPTEEPVLFSEREKNGEGGMTLRPGDRWGRGGSCAWIRLEGTAPEAPEGFEAAILLDAGGEACLFDENGNPLKGFTNVQSEFTVALGKPAKRVWFFPPEWCRKDLLLWADAGANDLFGWKPENGLFIQADFALFDSRKRALYYDLETLASYLEAIGEKDADGIFGRAEALWSDPEECASFVRSVLSGGNTDGNFVAALGHAHLDLAWLWPIRETKRKAVRTLSTVVSHMARYPDYRFCVSQPQMLSWVKESQPGLYEEIRRLHREGRVETVGGSWVEMDTNLPDGESLVRQMIYGQRFWKEEFGTPSGILWLPDTFGYSAQLPQLLKKAGMTYFLTTKLSWNAVNKFPYASFFWEGLDGTKVLTHIPPEGNYNSAARPDSVKKAEAAPCSMMLFGIGDGGGGPGMEHLERLAREKDLPGMPSVR
ncbi:MAG: alpha-mannosidase, partial [Clostridia bacterium]|nr:alpha-mannosidase [Clostridia bacterium]